MSEKKHSILSNLQNLSKLTPGLKHLILIPNQVQFRGDNEIQIELKVSYKYVYKIE